MLKQVSAIAGIFYFISIFAACNVDKKEEIIPVVQGYPDVEKELWAYFEQFEYEAGLRGFDVDLIAAGIAAQVDEIDEDHVAGQCSYSSHQGHRITIDESFWKSNISEYYKEMVVFHELGHCFLGRGHREDAFANGTCMSIMRSGGGDCRDNYNAATRSHYLDELFNNK